eukprot:s765_g33.t1
MRLVPYKVQSRHQCGQKVFDAYKDAFSDLQDTETAYGLMVFLAQSQASTNPCLSVELFATFSSRCVRKGAGHITRFELAHVSHVDLSNNLLRVMKRGQVRRLVETVKDACWLAGGNSNFGKITVAVSSRNPVERAEISTLETA